MGFELRTKGCHKRSSDSSVCSFSFGSFFQASLITDSYISQITEKSLIAASKISLCQDAQNNQQKKKKDILGMVLRHLCAPSYFWLVLGHVPSIIQNCLLNKYTLIFYHCGALGVAQEIHLQLVVWIMISPPPLPNHRTLVQ